MVAQSPSRLPPNRSRKAHRSGGRQQPQVLLIGMRCRKRRVEHREKGGNCRDGADYRGLRLRRIFAIFDFYLKLDRNKSPRDNTAESPPNPSPPAACGSVHRRPGGAGSCLGRQSGPLRPQAKNRHLEVTG